MLQQSWITKQLKKDILINFHNRNLLILKDYFELPTKLVKRSTDEQIPAQLYELPCAKGVVYQPIDNIILKIYSIHRKISQQPWAFVSFR